MVFSALSKSNTNNNNNEGWGLGLFFIFFHNNNYDQLHSFNNNNNITTRKRNSFSSTSTTSSTTTSNLLVSKTQSTLTICVLLVFTTLVLFTLSTFQPTTSTSHLHHKTNNNNNTLLSRRFLRVKANSHSKDKGIVGISSALQGMGEVYLRGSKQMSDIIVGHVSEDISEKQVVTFVRALMFSGLLSRTDLVLVFASPPLSAKFGSVVKSECASLLRIVQLGAQLGVGELDTGLTRYLRVVGEGGKESIWGRRGSLTSVSELTRSSYGLVAGESTQPSYGLVAGESTRTSYGSVVGFDSAELDPEGSLSGFLDHVPMSLRRWACYPMLLGRVRRNFKHVMLVDVANTLILSDPFTRVRNRSSESVLFWSYAVVGTESTRHGRKNSVKGLAHSQVNPGVVVGGSRGVRRFANAALTEIVRVSVENKGKNKNTVNELRLVNKLVQSGHLLKSIHLVEPTETVLDSSSLGGFNSVKSRLSQYVNASVVQRGESGVSGSFDLDDAVMKEICLSHKLFVNVYRDCLV